MLEAELKLDKLDKLIAIFSEKLPMVKIGILAGKSNRSTQGNKKSFGKAKTLSMGKGQASLSAITGTNASIGAKHEFGEEGMPIRSFLRMPLTEKMQEYLDNTGAFSKAVLKEVFDLRSVIPWLKKIGILGENIVSDAFASGGFGKWKPSDMTKKRNHQTLVETQQLRNSITSAVEE